MPRHVFYSFHYESDYWRAHQVRNMGKIDGNNPAHPNAWEEVKRGGDRAIKRWIDDQMYGRSCVVVLIGSGTYGREWIEYEIQKGWNDGKGVLGIHVHRLKDQTQNQTMKGQNPFSRCQLTDSGRPLLSNVVETYDPPYSDSKDAYNYIRDNIEEWIEDALEIRSSYE